MKTLSAILLLLASLTSLAFGVGQESAPAKAKAAPAKAAAADRPPRGGSHIPPDDNFCVQCHGDPDLWDVANRRLYITRDILKDDVHWRKGVNCSDCHGGDPKSSDVSEAHAKEAGFLGAGAAVRKMCTVCHDHQALEIVKSVHATAGERNDRGRGTPMECRKCHGINAHGILPAADARSPVHVDKQVETCGVCHESWKDSFVTTSHGHGLYQSGLLVTATCASCHGAHGVYRTVDQRSTLNPTNVADTCGKCHKFIAERLKKSVHGRDAGPGEPSRRMSPGGKSWQHPSCTSCHQGHQIVLAQSAQFRQSLPNLCGNCHAELSSRFAMTIHGELTALGYQPAANCYDCHGSHSILRCKDPASGVTGESRRETCRKCHPHVTANFVAFDPHVDYHDPKSNAVVYWVYRILLTLLVGTFAVFGLHSVLWFIRGLIESIRHGRPGGLRPGEEAYIRFVPMHRIAHAALLTSFLGLALTGLPLKYSDHEWAKALATGLGGFEGTSFWHRVCALVTFTCFGIYIVRLMQQFVAGHRRGTPWLKIIFGPDSPVPNWRDLGDFIKMVRWFFGLGPKPGFDRWAYWEKFDFWGANADIVIIGSTGLILWFPNFFCLFLPGVTLNVAKVIHSTQALLATGFIFAIHFFTIHLRAEKFPADLSLLVGLVSEEELMEERPDYYERLRAEGRLEQMKAIVPSKWHLRIVQAAGFLALFVGLALLAGMIAASVGG